MMIIVPLTFDESDAAIALWRAAGLLRPENDPAADIAAALAEPNATILAARDGEVLLGTVMVGYDGHRGWIYYLAVDAAQRRGGIGRALVVAAESWLIARGAPKIRLMVRDGNADAAGFYAAIGYARQAVSVMGRTFDEG